MRQKWSGLAARSVTASVFLAVLFVLYYFFDQQGLFFLSLSITMIMGFEIGQLTLKNHLAFLPLLFINFFWFSAVYLFNVPLKFLFGVLLISLTTWVWLARIRKISPKSLFHERAHVSGFLLFSLICPTFVLGHLRLPENPSEKFFFLLASVFLFDTLSFFFGKTLGGKVFSRKLFPLASPSKTIEGSVFGGLSSMALLIYAESFLPPNISPFEDLSLVVKIPLILLYYFLCLTGDLVESILKRSAGTKDSSSLLPGHGGFFDRLDGVLFAGILSYLLLQS